MERKKVEQKAVSGTPQQQPGDISQEVQMMIGAQAMQIIQLTKQLKERDIMLAAFEKESKELKAKVK